MPRIENFGLGAGNSARGKTATWHLWQESGIEGHWWVLSPTCQATNGTIPRSHQADEAQTESGHGPIFRPVQMEG